MGVPAILLHLYDNDTDDHAQRKGNPISCCGAWYKGYPATLERQVVEIVWSRGAVAVRAGSGAMYHQRVLACTKVTTTMPNLHHKSRAQSLNFELTFNIQRLGRQKQATRARNSGLGSGKHGVANGI